MHYRLYENDIHILRRYIEALYKERDLSRSWFNTGKQYRSISSLLLMPASFVYTNILFNGHKYPGLQVTTNCMNLMVFENFHFEKSFSPKNHNCEVIKFLSRVIGFRDICFFSIVPHFVYDIHRFPIRNKSSDFSEKITLSTVPKRGCLMVNSKKRYP